ncbi:MAG TPA: HEAT repeat domain-containing protein [Terriglobia bacterium]|nr:HEAT repeat domain-containing protein [Terriglobia bacterium]
MTRHFITRTAALTGLVFLFAGAPSLAAQQSSSEPSSDTARSLFMTGRNMWDEGRYAEAEKWFREALSRFPHSDQADRTGYYLIETLARMGRSKEALKEIDNFFRNYPKSKWFADVQEKRIGLTGQLPSNGFGPPFFNMAGRGAWDAGLAQEALRALLKNDEERGIGVMRERLKADPTDAACLGNLNTLADTGSSNAVSFLISIARTSESPRTRSTAVFWIGRIYNDKDGQAVKVLAEISRSDQDLSVRRAAIQALTPRKEPEAVKAIEEFLKGSH